MYPGLNQYLIENKTTQTYRQTFAQTREMLNEPDEFRVSDETYFNTQLRQDLINQVQQKLTWDLPETQVNSFYDIPIIRNIQREAKLNRILKQKPNKRDNIIIVTNGKLASDIQNELQFSKDMLDFETYENY
ncbi:MAG: hypothetical protein M0R46_16970 [Candidatus Muirbacterium halophilum]|nr:hypothetical protein [Candidatus Muirbacterium halophilum]